MNKTNIIECLENPLAVEKFEASEIRELLDLYPYSEAFHIIYLRKLYLDNDIRFDTQLEESSMHISNRTYAFNYINYTEGESPEIDIPTIGIANTDYFSTNANPEHQKSLQDLATRLKETRLARAAKKEEEEKTKPSSKTPSEVAVAIILNKDQENLPVSSDYFSNIGSEFSNALADMSSLALSINDGQAKKNEEKIDSKEIEMAITEISINIDEREEQAKQLIREKKYSDALEILKEINLNNSEKSIYFAVQIKYLETIIENNK